MIVGRLEDNYQQITFSGGGLRCFWQGGALDELRGVRNLTPDRVTAASGGALAGACFISGKGSDLVDAFCKRLDAQSSNIHMEWTSDVEEMTPHQELYRDVVEEVLSPDACQEVAEGPAFDVLLARPPRFLPT